MQKKIKNNFYEKNVKRFLDFVSAAIIIVIISPLLLILVILVRSKIGCPVLFTQERPGKDGKIFKMYKFRSKKMNTEFCYQMKYV